MPTVEGGRRCVGVGGWLCNPNYLVKYCACWGLCFRGVVASGGAASIIIVVLEQSCTTIVQQLVVLLLVQQQ